MIVSFMGMCGCGKTTIVDGFRKNVHGCHDKLRKIFPGTIVYERFPGSYTDALIAKCYDMATEQHRKDLTSLRKSGVPDDPYKAFLLYVGNFALSLSRYRKIVDDPNSAFVLDRYTSSTMVLQSEPMRISPSEIRDIIHERFNLPYPDINFLLWRDPVECRNFMSNLRRKPLDDVYASSEDKFLRDQGRAWDAIYRDTKYCKHQHKLQLVPENSETTEEAVVDTKENYDMILAAISSAVLQMR